MTSLSNTGIRFIINVDKNPKEILKVSKSLYQIYVCALHFPRSLLLFTGFCKEYDWVSVLCGMQKKCIKLVKDFFAQLCWWPKSLSMVALLYRGFFSLISNRLLLDGVKI